MSTVYLAHHGILGQKWGIRRFQNLDGTRTALGKKHRNEDTRSLPEEKKEHDKQKIKTAAKIGAGLVGAALVAYGGYKLHQYIKADRANWEYARQLVDDFNYDKTMSTKVGSSAVSHLYRKDNMEKLGNLGLTKGAMNNFKNNVGKVKDAKIIKADLNRYRADRAARLSKQLRYFT